MSIIPQREMRPTFDPTRDRCPGCNVEIAARLQLALESIRFAPKYRVTPELLILCRQCRRQFVVRPQPLPEGAR